MTTAVTPTLSAAFASALGGAPTAPGAGELLGLEHEYRLRRAGSAVDFRELIHGLGVPGRRLDPGDRNAYRCALGLVLTCDDAEAEVATPPVVARRRFSRALAGWAAAGRRELSGLLPADVTPEGYSTHLSASLPDRQALEVLDLFSRTFAPMVMLLLDGPDSSGVYVRPRPGRLELCGEYVTGEYLRAAGLFFTGGVRACAAALAGEPTLPALLEVQTQPAIGRYGVYVGRSRAFGFDLYRAGRSALLPRMDGASSINVGRQLTLAWEAARLQIDADAEADELAVVDAIVAGDLPLRVEAGVSETETEESADEGPAVHALGDVLEVRERPRFRVEAVVATWDFTVFRLTGRRAAYACVPRERLEAFLAKLDGGALDATLEEYLTASGDGRRLASNEQTRESGLWDELGSGPGLLSAERDPQTGRFPAERDAGGRSGKAGAGRAGKVGRAGGRPGEGPDVGAATDRPGKARARPGKPLVFAPPMRVPVLSPVPPPPPALPEGPLRPPPRAVRPRPAAPLPPDEAPPPRPPLPASDETPPTRPTWSVPLIATVVAAIIGVVVAAAAAGGVFSGGSSPPVKTATATASPKVTLTKAIDATAAPTLVTTPGASPAATVAGAGSGGTATPSSGGPPPTETPSTAATAVAPVATATAGLALTPTLTPTPGCVVGPAGAVNACTPTPTVIVAPTLPPPTPTCVVGPVAANGCTPTPQPPTATPTLQPTATQPPPTATRSPTPTGCFVNGAICTPTPTRTPGGGPGGGPPAQ